MCNLELATLLKEYQAGNMKNFGQIYAVFEKLINFYARRVRNEDSLQDLNVFLVELLYKIPLDKFSIDENENINKYIAVCLRNQYTIISKQMQRYNVTFVEYCDEISIFIPTFETSIDIDLAFSQLTKKQEQIICLKYGCGYSDIEIARYLQITRQSVNRLKIRAIEILKEYFNV